MIRSHIKTSVRNIKRNKLFSTINIVGLAISMSVGLLLIAFVLDLHSYDKFHKNGERIYRITNVASFNQEQSGKFASTSIKTESLSGEITGMRKFTIREDFSQMQQFGENILPIKASGRAVAFQDLYISDA